MSIFELKTWRTIPSLSIARARCIVEHGALPVISYMSNQRCGGEGLRVDRFFRVSGPAEERRVYGLGRASVERVNSRLELVGLVILSLEG